MRFLKIRDVKSPERGTEKSAGIDFFIPNDFNYTTNIMDQNNNSYKLLRDIYDINVNNYSNISSLIYDIEDILNNSTEILDDLEWVSSSIAESNYYNNTNK